jgi:hypothetical protein
MRLAEWKAVCVDGAGLDRTLLVEMDGPGLQLQQAKARRNQVDPLEHRLDWGMSSTTLLLTKPRRGKTTSRLIDVSFQVLNKPVKGFTK